MFSGKGADRVRPRDQRIRFAQLDGVTEPAVLCAEPPEQGIRLDHFLAKRLPQHSRARLQQLIKHGNARINGAIGKPAQKIRAGDVITIAEPPRAPATAPAEPIPLEIVFEDADLIVINKPPGLVVHPGAGHQAGTLVNALLYHSPNLSGIGGEQRPGIVHRLDKETSGCVVIAKNDAAHRHLAEQFAARTVTKIYLALAVGKFARSSGMLKTVLGRHPVHRTKMAVLGTGRGRVAETAWRVVRELSPHLSLVECTLHTGRTHQIRVHLKHLGHPVAGDALYGSRGGFSRQMLHAWRLGFFHPRTGARLIFESPIPADFVEAGAPRSLP
jgi:23S rRNA pseudouridine1911/1915/1917 synthase